MARGSRPEFADGLNTRHAGRCAQMLCHHQRPVHHVLVVVGQRYCSGAKGFAIDPGQSDVQPGDFNFARSCRNQPIDPIALTVGQFAFDLSILCAISVSTSN